MCWWESWTSLRGPSWPLSASPLLCCSAAWLRCPYLPGRQPHLYKQWFTHKINLYKFSTYSKLSTYQVPLYSPGPRWKGSAIPWDWTLHGNHHDRWGKSSVSQTLASETFRVHNISQHMSRKGRQLNFCLSFLSAPDLPWCSIQSKGQRWPACRDRWIPGPGDCPATRRVGPLHPHWTSQECPLSGRKLQWLRDLLFRFEI